jgi:hypothetical protein
VTVANIGDFGAAVREVKKARSGDPDTFTFYGETFRIADEIGVMPLMEFAAAASSGLDSAEVEGMAAMYAMLADCLADEERDENGKLVRPAEFPRFRQVAKQHKADGDTLLAVCTRVYEVVSGRPTEQPSDSSDGQSSTSPSSSPSRARRDALGLVPVEQALTG